MKKHNLLVAFVSLFLFSANVPASEWLTDLPAAQAKAKAENKWILVNFTGSDWCGWCKKLKAEVFDKPEFDAFAKENLLLVEIDFPSHKSQPAAMQRANQALATQYKVKGFPTLFILDSSGKAVGQTGYHPGGPQGLIAAMQKLSGGKLKVPPAATAPAQTAQAQQKESAPPPTPVPLFNGAPTAPPPAYKELQLKGISGPTGRRLAIINNQTLSEGEIAMVKMEHGQVKVECLQIQKDTAVVLLGDTKERKELRLTGSL